ncbi:MAG: hypothetical protein OEW00_00715 [candidate division Zixibacteria bacterium]|nr:hypothetical protein [candidate division Zixibacteria bacterium]
MQKPATDYKRTPPGRGVTAALCGAAVTAALWLGPGRVAARDISQGFFLEVDFCAMALNGKGTYNGFDFAVDKNWSQAIRVEESPEELKVRFDQSGTVGFNWNSRYLAAVVPRAGYRFTRRFALTLAYRHYYTKEGSQTQAFAADPDGPFSSIKGFNEFTTSYRQRAVEIAGQYYLGRTGLFVTVGLEYITLQLEITSEWTQFTNDVVDYIDPFAGRGEDHVFGYLVGIGYEKTLAGRLGMHGRLVYSRAKYSGDNLLAEFNVGGIRAGVGVGYYIR